MKRPKLAPTLSSAEFKKAIAAHAASLDNWICLEVAAFASDADSRAARLARVHDKKSGYQFFIETYLPHYVKGAASAFHKSVYKRFPDILFAMDGNKKRGARDCFIAPRGSSKSTHLSLGGALYAICLGLERYIIEICDVYSQAALLIEAIKSELTQNPRLKHDFPDACGTGRVWREGEIVTRNDIRVDGLGAGQKIRGRRHGPYRPGLIFLDDLENDAHVRSPEQRDKLENWIDGAALECGPPDGSMRAIYVGTILHFDAVIARKAKSPDWVTTKFQAIMAMPERMDLWDVFEEHYRNEGRAAAERYYQNNRRAMDAGAQVNWPAQQSLLMLMLKRAANKAAFAKEYQNAPISENSPFTQMQYWVVKRRDLLHFGAIDPSLGRKGRGRDPSAILVGGFDPDDKKLFLLEASIRSRLPDVIIGDAIALQREYRCYLWFVEATQYQEFLRTELMQKAIAAGVPLSAYPITPHADKHLRIERLQPPVAAGLILFHASQSAMIEQMQQFPNGAHDDGPDCLDMLYTHGARYAFASAAANPDAIKISARDASSTALEGYLNE